MISKIQNISLKGSQPAGKQEGFDDKQIDWDDIEDLGERFLDQFHIGYACKKGLKPESPNQDDFCITLDGDALILGVFDGHGQYGHDVSNFVHTYLPTAIL